MRSAALAGAVFVRPIGLSADPALNRYQYQRLGSSPVASAWTEWPNSGVAASRPLRTIFVMPSSEAISQSTQTAPSCQSRCAAGSAINRVQRTTLFRVGSPDATPTEKGSAENFGVDWIADRRRNGYPSASQPAV